MSELQIVNFDGVEVVDSRDIAVMVERDHNELLKSIRIYAKYLDEGEVPQVDFFIESTYTDSQNRTYPNYLITKKGCDLIANKMIGKKGILFTAAYVSAFERMRKQAMPAPMSPAQLIAAQAQLLVDMEKRMDEMQGQTRALEAKVDTAMKALSRPAEDHWRSDMDKAIKELNADMGWSLPKLRGKLFAELEQTVNCNLNMRVTTLRKRMKKTGMRYRDAKELGKLDAIAADKQLRAIFEGIVRSYQAQVVHTGEVTAE